MDSDVMKAARKALSVWTEARMRERIAEKLAKTYRDAGFTHALMRVALAGIEAATQPDPWTPSGAEWDYSMHNNPRGDAWAKAFVQTFPGLADKEDVMLGWFCNAMMAMHDYLKNTGPLNGDMAEAMQEAATAAEAESEPCIINLGDALKRSVAEAEAKRAAEAAPSDAEIVEALADLEHEQWMAWSKDIAKKEPLSTARFDRWSAYWVPYADLENDVKEHDRKWARKALEIVRRARQPQPADELFLSSQVAKMRAERDRAVEALRGLVELAKAVKAEDDYLEKTEHHDNYTDRSRSWARQAKATRDLVDATLRTAREVLDGR